MYTSATSTPTEKIGKSYVSSTDNDSKEKLRWALCRATSSRGWQNYP